MNSKKLVVILPAYNEEKDVERLVKRWNELQKDISDTYHLALKIVVVNDGSKDRTETICKQLENTYSHFKLVNHEHNKGLGRAVETGFNYAMKSEAECEYICVMDCDNTQDPKYIMDMLEKISGREHKDIIIASRYQNGAKVYGLAKYRLLMSEGARIVYQSILRIKNVRDYTCGYRLYRKSILQRAVNKYGEAWITQRGFTCMTEILYKLYCVGAVCSEVPFQLHYDYKQGKSKMKVFKTAKDSVALAFRLRRQGKKGWTNYEVTSALEK